MSRFAQLVFEPAASDRFLAASCCHPGEREVHQMRMRILLVCCAALALVVGMGAGGAAADLPVAPPTYDIQLFTNKGTTFKVGTTIQVRVVLSVNGVRISDAEAAALLPPQPPNGYVIFQPVAPPGGTGLTKMTYDRDNHEFKAQWKIPKYAEPGRPEDGLFILVINPDGSTNNSLLGPIALTA